MDPEQSGKHDRSVLVPGVNVDLWFTDLLNKIPMGELRLA